MTVINDKKSLSKILFGCFLVLDLTIAALYLYNIVRWGSFPELGFAFRSATGVKVVGVVSEVGRKAGVEVGDRVLLVNGKSFTNARELRSATNRKLGEKNTYLIEKKGQRLEISITNVPFGLQTSFKRSGFPYLVGICYVLIGTLVFLMKPYQRTSWIFFFFGTTFGLLITFLFKLSEMRPLWLGTVHIFLYAFTPATFIHLALSFPEERSLIKGHPWTQLLPYLVSLVLFLGISSATPEMLDIPRAWSIALTAYLAVALLLFLASCSQLWLKSSSELAKRRSKTILLGAAISASIPLSETVINAVFHFHVVPSFNYYLPFLIVFPLFVGYSIVKHNLFDIDAIIKRTYGYILTTGSIVGVYGLVVLISNLAFARLEITKSPIFPLVFVLAVVFLFNPLRNRVQKFIDRVFYRLEYDYQETVQRISEALRSLLHLDEIGKNILNYSMGVMFIESGSVMVLNPREQIYESITEPSLPLKIPAEDPLIQKISTSKKEVTLYDIQEDPLFEKVREACKKTFEELKATLIVPVIYEDHLTGLISLGSKKSGKFYRREDINLLKTLANQGAVALENARLHQAHIEALENSKKELEQLNRAKSRALDHLSHELRTPLAVIQGNIRILRRETQAQTPPIVRAGEIFESLEKNLSRLLDIEQETNQIIRSHQELEVRPGLEGNHYPPSVSAETIHLYSFVEGILEDVKKQSNHRTIQFEIDGGEDLNLAIDPKILEACLVGLLKNAIENTPDGGMIRVVLEKTGQWIQLKIMDFGIGITKENQRHLFDGLFHTQDTELYRSKRPYDFGAGGKGLDLLRTKVYSKRFGFDISVASQRCLCLPTDGDRCPGRISECPHCRVREDCFNSGGSTFCLTFTVVGG